MARDEGGRSPDLKEWARRGASVRQALAEGSARLGGVPSEAFFDANVLLRHVSGRDAAWLLAHGDEALEPEVLTRYARALERRFCGEPVAYITGESWFYGRRFELTPAVLVPRPETEQLLELTLHFLDGLPMRRPRVCDVGTGSGILAISLALERPALLVSAIERSRDALEQARHNARLHGVEERIDFRHGDLFAGATPLERFDCIVANLPYVPTGELKRRPHPTGFEPRHALDGGEDGLVLYRRLLRQAPDRLEAGGGMFLEAGPGTAAELAGLASQRFPGKMCVVERDYAGLERIVALTG
jgi:release factor glutamine methyltransferase